jgi:hypothetical protein
MLAQLGITMPPALLAHANEGHRITMLFAVREAGFGR